MIKGLLLAALIFTSSGWGAVETYTVTKQDASYIYAKGTGKYNLVFTPADIKSGGQVKKGDKVVAFFGPGDDNFLGVIKWGKSNG